MSVGSALLIGFCGGCVCYLAVAKVKAKLQYDDSLDAFGVHGVGSTIGMLLCGLLASARVNPAIASTYRPGGGDVVSLEGSLGQMGNQAIGILTTALLGAVMTFVILKVVALVTGGLRVDEEAEEQGLDISHHGEEAYNS